MMKKFALVFVVVLSIVTMGGAISCGEVTTYLTPCIGYLSGSGKLPDTCCSGVRGLSGRAQSRQDKRTVCECIKSAASGYNINYDIAAGLPGKCGISIGFGVSRGIDCSRVS